jgi:hypothetical protein
MAPDIAALELMCLPTEVLEPIFALTLPSMTGADLKQLRLANKRLSLFVEPYLFRSICFSTAEDNFQAWKRVTDPGSLLRHQVEHVCIDSTTFIHKITKVDYCERLAQHLTGNSCKGPPPRSDVAKTYTSKNLLFDLTHPKRKSKLLPGDRRLLCNGFKDYLRHAKSQRKIGSDGVYRALAKGLPSLPRVKEFSFITQWQVGVPAVRKWRETDVCYEKWEGGSFTLPGPIAREHPPLRLPPESTQPRFAEDGAPILTHDFWAVLRAVRHLNLDLRGLACPQTNVAFCTPIPLLEHPFPLRHIGLPLEAFRPSKWYENEIGIKDLFTAAPNPFRNLKNLELAFSPSLHDEPRVPRGRGYLPHLFRSLPVLESLVLKGYRREGLCHKMGELSYILGVTEAELSPHDVPSFSPNAHSVLASPFQYSLDHHCMLYVFNLPFYANLKNLELSEMEANAGTLVELLRTTAPTLEVLVLQNISISYLYGSLYQLKWSHVLDAMRKIFSHKSPPLDFSLSFGRSRYRKLLYDLSVSGSEVHKWMFETEEVQLRKIEKYVTSEGAELRFPGPKVPLMP